MTLFQGCASSQYLSADPDTAHPVARRGIPHAPLAAYEPRSVPHRGGKPPAQCLGPGVRKPRLRSKRRRFAGRQDLAHWSVSTSRLAEFVKLCKSNLGRMDLDLSIGTFVDISSALKKTRCDIGFLPGTSDMDDLDMVDIGRYKDHACVGRGHPWANRAIVSITGLHGVGLIISPAIRRSRQVFGRHGRDLHPAGSDLTRDGQTSGQTSSSTESSRTSCRERRSMPDRSSNFGEWLALVLRVLPDGPVRCDLTASRSIDGALLPHRSRMYLTA